MAGPVPTGPENNLRFPGQYFDSETGLHYNWNRYYEPGTGRYLRVDPVGIEGGINLYVYTDNNAINLIDTMGCDWTSIPGIGLINNLINDPVGMNLSDYSVTIQYCDPLAIDECKDRVRAQYAKFAYDYTGTNLIHEGLDALSIGTIGVITKMTPIGWVANEVFFWEATLDGEVTWLKIEEMQKALKAAEKKCEEQYKQCCSKE